MGSSLVIAKTIAELERRDPDTLRQMLLSDDWLVVALEGFHARLRAHKRDAIRQYFEAIKLIGKQDQLSVSIVLSQHLGTKDQAESDRLLSAARRARESTPDDAFRIAKELVRQRIAKDPAERRRVAQELFGVMDVADVVPAPALNGHTNGNGVHK